MLDIDHLPTDALPTDTSSKPTHPRQLVLGSTSRYRRELLDRLNTPFDVASPDVDELVAMKPKAAGLKLYFGHTTGNTEEYVLDHARTAIDTWIKSGGQRFTV